VLKIDRSQKIRGMFGEPYQVHYHQYHCHPRFRCVLQPRLDPVHPVSHLPFPNLPSIGLRSPGSYSSLLFSDGAAVAWLFNWFRYTLTILSHGFSFAKRTHLFDASRCSENGVSKLINVSCDGLMYGFLDARFLRVLAMFLCSWLPQFTK
jgi:hypothetical protein